MRVYTAGEYVYIMTLSILTTILPGEPGLACFIGANDDGSGGDNWRCNTCKAPVKS